MQVFSSIASLFEYAEGVFYPEPGVFAVCRVDFPVFLCVEKTQLLVS